MRGAPNQDAVRDHYRKLARHYDAKANRACKHAYTALLRRWLHQRQAILEIGAGATPLLHAIEAPMRAACDLSAPMLAARPPGREHRIAADAQSLPFQDGAFDGAYSINVLEHVPHPETLVREAHRVLRPGGLLVLVTPNGDAEWLLDWLERLRLKLPEGPHRFLGMEALRGMAREGFEPMDQGRFLAFPAGPRGLVQGIDKHARGWGLFLYAAWRRCA